MRAWLFALLFAATIGPAALGQPCPNGPLNVVADTGVCAVRLRWTPGAGAVGFVVYRSTDSHASSPSSIGSAPGPTASSYTDSTASRNVQYYYWVDAQPLNALMCIPRRVGPIAGALVPSPAPPPTAVTPSCAGTTVAWQTFFDATGYEIIRTNQDTSEVVTLATPSTSPYLDTSGPTQFPYTYAVRPLAACLDACSALAVTQSAPQSFLGPPSIIEQPQSMAADIGQKISLSPAYTEGIPPHAAQWSRDGVPLVNGGRITGADTFQIFITGVRLEDAGVYTLRLDNGCGSVTTQAAILAVRVGCRADFNQSGVSTVQDLFDFLAVWFAGCP